MDGVNELILPDVAGVRVFEANLDHVVRTLDPDDFATLSLAERKRASRFLKEVHANRFRTSRIILRRLAADLLDRDPALLEIVLAGAGKPSFVGEALRFNLSHSREHGVFAFVTDRAVGVDLETRLPDNLEAVSERVLGRAELAVLDAQPDGLRGEWFLRYWVTKEAILKTSGEGLLRDARDLQVDVSGDEPRLLSAPAHYGDLSAWTLRWLQLPGSEAAAALALAPEAVDF